MESPARRWQWRLIAVLLLAILAPAAGRTAEPAEEADTLERLAWLAGHWAGESRGVVSEEWWTRARGGVMLGLHRDAAEDGRAFFEYLRIVESEDGLEYWAQPMGRSPTRFVASEVGEQSVVFENAEHDFPKKISYSLDGEGRLVARVEGDPNDAAKASEWRWKRVQ